MNTPPPPDPGGSGSLGPWRGWPGLGSQPGLWEGAISLQGEIREDLMMVVREVREDLVVVIREVMEDLPSRPH